MFLSYSIFTDKTYTAIREVVNLQGEKADDAFRSFCNLKGWEPKEGDVIAGCRIDRIESEDITETL